MYIPEFFRSRVVLTPQTTATAYGAYLAPTPGIKSVTLRVIVTMGNDTDLPISLKTADDATGTNSVDFTNVPFFINGIRQVDGHSTTIAAPSGTFIVDFCIMPGQIPQGKTIGIAYGASNVANFIVAEIIEDTVYKPAN